VRLEIGRRVAEWNVCRELTLETEVERPRNAIAAARRAALVRLLLLVLANAPFKRVKVELGWEVLGKRSRGTHAHVVAEQEVSTTYSSPLTK